MRAQGAAAQGRVREDKRMSHWKGGANCVRGLVLAVTVEKMGLWAKIETEHRFFF